MSFFAIEPRQFGSSPKNQFNIGPGKYQNQTIIKTAEKSSYAPFGSLQSKKIKYKTQNNLGPGQYQVQGQICKPSITKYENNNCIIIKINQEGWSQFKSHTNRFQDSLAQKQKHPGPGQYQPDRKKLISINKIKSKSSIGQRIKQINLINYNERRKPTLFTDKKQFDENFVKNTVYKGSKWSLSKKQRFQPLIKEVFYEEHKGQIIQKIKDQRKKQRSKSQSAVFISKSLKSQLEADIYQSQNPFKVQIRKKINYKDDRPGPGSYNHHLLQQQNRVKFHRHQFFGSTVQRFGSQSSTQLGPGYYAPRNSSQRYKQHKHHHLNDQSQQLNRHSYISFNQQIPGPGTYSVDGKRKHKSSCKWVFGSKQPRFSQMTTVQQNQQQIDQYQLQRKIKRQKQFEYRKQFLNNKNQPIFSSNTKRFEQPNKAKTEIPIGKYNITQTDIAEKAKKVTVDQHFNSRFTRQQAQSHPFMSSVYRFKTQVSQNQQNPHHDCWCLVKSVEKQVFQHQSSSFTSKQKRTVVFQNNDQRHTPAVGSYTKESSFVKSSFNSKFIKANESKSKKLKIWNTQKNKWNTQKQTYPVQQETINLINAN